VELPWPLNGMFVTVPAAEGAFAVQPAGAEIQGLGGAKAQLEVDDGGLLSERRSGGSLGVGQGGANGLMH